MTGWWVANVLQCQDTFSAPKLYLSLFTRTVYIFLTWEIQSVCKWNEIITCHHSTYFLHHLPAPVLHLYKTAGVVIEFVPIQTQLYCYFWKLLQRNFETSICYRCILTILFCSLRGGIENNWTPQTSKINIGKNDGVKCLCTYDQNYSTILVHW